MPIYAYKCSDCGHEREVLQKISDAPLTDCPDCGQPSMAKQVTAAGFQLKGSGWYATDFRNKDSGGRGGKAGDKAGASDSANDAKADSAPTPAAAPAASGHACGTGGCGSCS
ncbi:MAG: zinc ribbon domain-containing protein [Burkholderiaceae bacterium]|jgi:putative FmdB family regulatory protein|nr:zinc ribbon domain-containing protein [Burkholderiaceae bacterium]MDH5209269.1 zinc ribbon domain-containing protein [Burkholderiaceae bacterium]